MTVTSRGGTRGRARGCAVALASLVAALAVFGFVAYQLRAPLLTRMGSVLYHADPLEPSDVIVVLAAGSLDGDLEAADLFHAGYAPLVLLRTESAWTNTANLRAHGLARSAGVEGRLEFLESLNVPREATIVLRGEVASSWAEVALLAQWAQPRRIQRMIVVAPGYRTSRVRYLFDQAFRGLPVEVRVRPSQASGFDPSTWCGSRESLAGPSCVNLRNTCPFGSDSCWGRVSDSRRRWSGDPECSAVAPGPSVGLGADRDLHDGLLE